MKHVIEKSPWKRDNRVYSVLTLLAANLSNFLIRSWKKEKFRLEYWN